MTTQTVSPTPVKVDVWSDIACPFCYIGKRKFEEAAATSGIPIELEYHSYELAPDTDDVVPHSHLEHLVNRMGVSHAQAACWNGFAMFGHFLILLSKTNGAPISQAYWRPVDVTPNYSVRAISCTSKTSRTSPTSISL